MLFWLTVILASLGIFYLWLKSGPKGLPPSVPSLPIIGSLPFLGPDMRKNISKFRKKYGPVFGMKIGTDYWVTICDFQLSKQILGMEEFADRPPRGALNDFFFRDEKGAVRGVMFSNGTEWQEQRRFVLRHLKDFGFGKIGMEPFINEEIEKSLEMVTEELSITPHKRISLNQRLNVAILNALWHISTGEKLKYDDPQLKVIVDRITSFMTATSVGGPLLAMPWLKYFIPDRVGYTNAKYMFEGVLNVIHQTYNGHVDSFQPEQMRDFMDVYIQQIKEAKEDPLSSFHRTKGEQNLFSTMINLFIGGSETTSNTLNWALFYLSKDQALQKEAVEELGRVIGFDRAPSMSDRPNTPLLEAIVQETHRIAALAFLGIPRKATRDVTVGGYFFPKDTSIMTGIYEIMHDVDYWKDPETFRPERFLNETRTKVTNTERLIPFGYGKRMCIGSLLAQSELYLFVASFLQRFKFEDPNPSILEPKAGFVLGCPKFTMKVTERGAMKAN